VSGGGTAYLSAAKSLDELLETLEGDEKTGAKIIRRAIEEPIRQICENAGLEGSVIIENLKHKEEGMGYDAAKNMYVDMFEAGIIDPTKVTRSAIQNAASVSSMFLTTEVAVVEMPKEEPQMPAGGMGGMGGGMPMM
ncbi:MAG TPA: chaperonin GroEL, partial [Eubacteriaceae bacterium]|nr:chaperonin GroEL [Eubacteriaceae bacterium]